MKNILRSFMVLAFIVTSAFVMKLDVKAEIVRNLTGERTNTGWVYDYKYWNGSGWVHCADKSYTNSGLKKITVKTAKLKSVGKNALKGIHKKTVIKVPKKTYTKYKKLFKGKGQGRMVKIKK